MVAAAAATGILSLCGSPALADAQADGAARNSAGFMSGNVVQVPVDAPVNACGNTVDAAAALNPSFGNRCGPDSDEHGHGSDADGYGADDDSGYGSDDSGYGSDDDSGYGAGYGSDGDGGYGSDEDSGHGSAADGRTEGSSGTGSGNVVQLPVDAPVNACGNTVNLVGLLNPVAGNRCEQGGYGYGDDETPPAGHTPPPADEEKPPPSDEKETPPADEKEVLPPADEESTPPADGGHEAVSLPETGSHGLLAAGTAAAGLITGGVLLYRRGRAGYLR